MHLWAKISDAMCISKVYGDMKKKKRNKYKFLKKTYRNTEHLSCATINEKSKTIQQKLYNIKY